MEQLVWALFDGASGAMGYALVFGALVACGLGLPLPEDVVLIAGGVVAQQAQHDALPMIAVGLLGILAGDSVIYGFGRRFGERVTTSVLLRRTLTPERLVSAKGLFDRHGQKILVAARFMPGVRAVAFFTSGAMGVPYYKFLLYDGLAALVSAPLWVLLGHRFGQQILDTTRQYQWIVLGGIGALLAVGWLWRRARRRSAATAPTSPTAPTRTELP